MSSANSSSVHRTASRVPAVVSVILILLVAAVARGAETFDLRPAPLGESTYRVTVELEFGGELLAENQLAATAPLAEPPADDAPSGDAPTDATNAHRQPLSVEAHLEYDERLVADRRSVRHYHRADGTVRSSTGAKLPRLGRERRQIVAELADAGRPLLWSPTGRLTREELDLIDIAGDAAALDRVMPAEPIDAEGDWQLDAQAVGPLLGLDSVAVCEVRGVVDESNRRYARFQLAGTVQGAVDAAATELSVRAVGLFDRQTRRVTQLNLAIEQDREIGAARPGVDGTTKIKIKRTPVATPAELSDATASSIAAGKDVRQPNALELTLPGLRQGFRATHSRGWFVASETRDAMTLRLVDASGLLAQTTLRRLPPKADERRPTLESFKEDLRSTHGEAFTELVSNERWTSPAGCECLGIVFRGEAEGVPVEWRRYLVLPPVGAPTDARHLVSIATTIEQPMTDRVGHADRALADSLTLARPESAAAATVTYRPTPRTRPAIVRPQKTTRPQKTASRPKRRRSTDRRRR